jgi:hypothetical protein
MTFAIIEVADYWNKSKAFVCRAIIAKRVEVLEYFYVPRLSAQRNCRKTPIYRSSQTW